MEINVICGAVEKNSIDDTGTKFDINFISWSLFKEKVLSMRNFNITVKMGIGSC